MMSGNRRSGSGTGGSNRSSLLSAISAISHNAIRRSTGRPRSTISEEDIASRSSGITALPVWDSSRSSPIERPRTAIPFPRRIYSSHGRKNSHAPILEEDVMDKDRGFHISLASLGIRRSGSQKSHYKAPPVCSVFEVDDDRKCLPRKYFWLVAIAVVVISLAIILGAVLGTTIKIGSSGPRPKVTEIPAGSVPTPSTTASASSPTPTGNGLPPDTQLASLAVTGWQVPGSQGYNSIWLFWQNKEGFLSRATYNSSTGNWTRVTNFAEARKKTPLGAAAVNLDYYAGNEAYSFPPGEYQASVVYLDEKNYLQEWTFSDSGSDTGQAGSLSGQDEIAHEATKIGYYWPQLIYQGMSGEVRSAFFECHHKDQCWHESVLNMSAPINGTSFVAVPAANNLSSTSLFYQEDDGRTVVYSEKAEEEADLREKEAFSTLIPANASIAAFSTTRSNNLADNALNTYLLWQDVNGTIQMSWTDDNNGWKGPITHPAFAGAENNTAIACLTGLTFPGFPLQSGTELARCYFQTGLALREVSFDGQKWGIVGVVPIDY